jgi:hypothetical protein
LYRRAIGLMIAAGMVCHFPKKPFDINGAGYLGLPP